MKRWSDIKTSFPENLSTYATYLPTLRLLLLLTLLTLLTLLLLRLLRLLGLLTLARLGPRLLPLAYHSAGGAIAIAIHPVHVVHAILRTGLTTGHWSEK
jgi:hypothetical protein